MAGSNNYVESRRHPVQMAQFLQREIDTQNMNIVVAVLTTGIDAAVQSSSAQPGSSSEQNVDALDKKLTDSLWAVASNRDREHKETHQT